MRAVLVEQFSQVDSLRILNIPYPEVTSGEVLVQVKAAGLGFVDALKIAGLYQTKDPLPFVPGMEFSGIVCRLGDRVSHLKVGDRVFGLAQRGALAEKIVAPAEELSLVPQSISFAQAAAIPINYLTALYGLRDRANLSAGERLLVLGAAGGTGIAAIKVGRMIGATVIAAASTDEKRSFVRGEGADAAIDYTRDGWREELKSLTKGQAIDVIFDAIGGEVSPVAFRTLGWRGRHLVVGFAAGTIPSLPFNIALLKGASLVGVDSAQIQKHEPGAYARIMDEIRGLLEDHSLEPSPTQSFPFEMFKEAFRAIQGRRALGKIVLEVA
jgi:NADPH2:quinone reductase